MTAFHHRLVEGVRSKLIRRVYLGERERRDDDKIETVCVRAVMVAQ